MKVGRMVVLCLLAAVGLLYLHLIKFMFGNFSVIFAAQSLISIETLLHGADKQTNSVIQHTGCSQTTRVEKIHKLCLKYDVKENFDDVALDFLLTDDTHKVIYCPLPKAGCTTFKQLLVDSLGKSLNSNEDIHHERVMEYVGIKTLNKYSKEEIDFRLKSYFKFMVVRHPFDRLISAFNNKLRGHPINYGPHFHIVIREHFGKITERDSTGKILINVNQFLHLVAKEPDRFKNIHWQDSMSYCHPCLIRYDHVIYMETLERDAGRVLDHLPFPNGTRPVLSHLNQGVFRTSNRSDEVYNVFKGLDPHVLRRLLDMYALDFNVFGYTWNSSTRAKCSKCVC
jgi:hypothetical protein